MGWGLIHSALLGVAISSTDAAALFGILKTRKLSLKPKTQSLLEVESGSNDPMAVFFNFGPDSNHLSSRRIFLVTDPPILFYPDVIGWVARLVFRLWSS